MVVSVSIRVKISDRDRVSIKFRIVFMLGCMLE